MDACGNVKIMIQEKDSANIRIYLKILLNVGPSSHSLCSSTSIVYKKILKLKFQVCFFLHFTETIKSSMALAMPAIFSTTSTKPIEKFVWMEN